MTTLLFSNLDPSKRTLANAISNLIHFILPYFLSPLLYGLLTQDFKLVGVKRGFKVLILTIILSSTFMYFAFIFKYKNSIVIKE